MNVGELIEELGAPDRDLPVAMLSRLGDFCILDEPRCRQAGLVIVSDGSDPAGGSPGPRTVSEIARAGPPQCSINMRQAMPAPFRTG